MKTLRHSAFRIIHSAPALLALCAPVALPAAIMDFPGGNYTDDIYLSNETHTFNVTGDTTISGRIYGTVSSPYSVPNGGAFIKTGDATLTITGERNWFLGPNVIEAGTLVITQPGALGHGNVEVRPGATFVIRDFIDNALYPQAITGGGRVEVADSVLTINHRQGSVANPPVTSESDFSQLAVTRSHLRMLASGMLTSGLGGSGVAVTVADHSTLILGREGVVPGASGMVAPINYPIYARTLDIDATSALVLNPNASLIVTGTLALNPESSFSLGGPGVIRLEYASLAPGSASPDVLVSVPDGYAFDSTSLISNGNRQRRDYLVVNQGANPMHDLAMTAGAIDTILETAASRITEFFLLPASELSRFRQTRKWANNAWARYIYSVVDYESDSAAQPGHDGVLNGLVLGLDSAYRQRVNLGFYCALTENTLDTTNDTSLMSKQRYFGLSATPRIKRLYLTVDVFSGNADSESFRLDSNGSTTAHWNNTFRGGGIEIGTVLRPWKNGFLRPRAAMRHTRISVKGYSERAPLGATPIDVKNFTESLAHFNLALEAAHRVKLFNRDTLLGATLGCKRYVSEPSSTLVACYRDYPEYPFEMKRGDYYEDSVSLGASMQMSISSRLRAGLALSYERGANHDRLTASAVVNCIW